MTDPTHLDILNELAALGMDIARTLHAEALAADHPRADTAAAFERIARAVRRTVVTAHHLANPARATPAPSTLRRQVIRAAEDAIARTHPPDPAALRAELYDRIDRPEFEHELADRPVADIIAEIVQDLNLAPGAAYPRRTPDDIAALHARAIQVPANANTLHGHPRSTLRGWPGAPSPRPARPGPVHLSPATAPARCAPPSSGPP